MISIFTTLGFAGRHICPLQGKMPVLLGNNALERGIFAHILGNNALYWCKISIEVGVAHYNYLNLHLILLLVVGTTTSSNK